MMPSPIEALIHEDGEWVFYTYRPSWDVDTLWTMLCGMYRAPMILRDPNRNITRQK